MLTLRNISVRIGQREILKDADFTLEDGCLTVLVGRNGSGKSTLLSCVNQQLPYTGEILVDEQEFSCLSPRQRARRVAILPQRMAVPHITVKEMTAFGRNPYLDFTGRLSAGDRQAVIEALEFSDALSLADRYVDTLSGGERQRAALAMVLAQNTPILLLDEPTAHMDPAYEAQFLSRLRELKRRGKTILVVLHDLTQAVACGDRLVVLDGGTVVFSGTKEACLAGQVLEKTFSLRRYTVSEGTCEKLFFSAD